MKFGICTGGADAKDPWGIGYDRLTALAHIGYDYAELPLAAMARMSDAEFAENVLPAVRASALACLACNAFFPGDIRLTGEGVDPEKIRAYVEIAAERARQIGVKVIVLGSGGARNLPTGWPLEEGYRQMADALKIIGPIAKAKGIQIALEPLNRQESNILNSYLSALYLAALSGQENVGALVDSFHFLLGNESVNDLYIKKPVHVHIARTLGRKVPDVAEPALAAFFAALKGTGYDGLVSLEGGMYGDFEADAKRALEVLRELSK